MSHPESWFSADYAEARAKFLSAAAAAGATVAHNLNPNAKQPDGGDLFTDVARLGPAPGAAAKVLIATSGTHGVEGFCGSGSLIAMLDSGLHGSLPDDTSLVLIHAINPYGFAWLRRVTEDNIDLNRNNLDHTALNEAGGHPANPKYDEVHPILTPAEWTGPVREEADAAIATFIQERGLFAFQEAVSGGQYNHPDGLFYGGQAQSWSSETWWRLAVEHSRGAKNVAHLDFHTGLGEYGACELISVESNGDGADDRALAWYGDEVRSPEKNESLSAVVTGLMENAFNTIRGETEVTSVALEYGTKPVTEVLEALRADNWLHLHGDMASDEGKAIKRQIRDAFYGDTPDWKADVWRMAEHIFHQAAAGLAGAPVPGRPKQ